MMVRVTTGDRKWAHGVGLDIQFAPKRKALPLMVIISCMEFTYVLGDNPLHGVHICFRCDCMCGAHFDA